MNQIKYCLPVLLLLSIMVGCDNEPEESPEEEIRTLTVTETTGQGSEKVTTKQQFFYETGKLVQHTTTQTFTDLFCQTEYTWTVSTQIGYESGKVIASDDAGNVSTYLMRRVVSETNLPGTFVIILSVILPTMEFSAESKKR